MGAPRFFDPRNITLSRIILLLCCLVLIFLVLYPLLALVQRSFGWPTLTFDHYLEALTTPHYMVALGNSLLVSVGATLIAGGIGILLAWIVTRTNLPFKSTFEILFIIPYFVSPFIIAMAWTFIAGPFGIINFFVGQGTFNVYNIFGLIWIMGINFMPLMFIFVSSALKSMDSSLEEASRSAGANVLKTSLRITLPLISPSILSGLMLVFISAMSMFSIPVLIGRPYGIHVLTTVVYDLTTRYPPFYGTASAISILLLSFGAIGILIQRRTLGGRQYVTVTPRGFRPRTIDLGRKRYLCLLICMIFATLTLILPMLVLAVASFCTYWNPWKMQFSLATWDYIFFKHPTVGRAIQNSLVLGNVGATITVILTLLISYLLIRTKTAGRGLLEFISLIPVALPAVCLALGLLSAWINAPIAVYGTIWILLIAYITIYSPYGVRILTAVLRQISSDLEETARTCGASTLRTIKDITIPLLKPGILSAWLLILVGMIREISSSILLVSWGNEVMSTVLYELWAEVQTSAAAMALFQTAVVLVCLLIFRRILGADITKLA